MQATRRDFLKASLGASTLASFAPAAPALLSRAAAARATHRDVEGNVLVAVQLAGGNDGLNTLAPYGDDLYAKNRPTIHLPPERLHKIDSLLGFHPSMGAFFRLYREGRLSIVQGVGYPNPSGGHFEAMRNWQTARPHDAACQTGWLGRAIDQGLRRDEMDPRAAFVGRIAQPFALNAEQAITPSIRSLEQCVVRPMPGDDGRGAFGDRLAAAARRPRRNADNPLLALVQRSTLAACHRSRRIEAVSASAAASPPSTYPPLPLAQMLHIAAQLIRADLGIRIYYVELGGQAPGGFDTHANQLANHGALLGELSESVAAFVSDLARDRLLDRILLMTFSEFGRTVKENGRRGTGHGSAAPMFLVGGKLRGGLVGAAPNLTDLENGGVPHRTDFRRVYATALDQWLGLRSRAILGGSYEPLDLLES